MDDTLKRNIRKTGIFMLITALLPGFYFLGFLLGFSMDSPVAYWLCFAIAYWGYFLSAFFVLVWGSITIWQFPFEKIRRALLIIAWLMLYPVLCMAWLMLFLFTAAYFFKA